MLSSFCASATGGAIGDVREWNDFFHFSARGGIIDGRLKRLVGHASITAIGGKITL